MVKVLVICESGYWRDLREALARVDCEFLGFDKKKPHRQEIDQLVTKADFVMIRNINVAHHSVRFAKEAAKASETPFWVGRNFGAEKMIELLKTTFPNEDFSISTSKNEKIKEKKQVKSKNKKVQKLVSAAPREIIQPKSSKKNLALKSQLKGVFIEEDEIDFEKMFKR